MSPKHDPTKNVARLIHLAGGVRALSNPGSNVVFTPPRTGVPESDIEYDDYKKLTQAVVDVVGIWPIGTEYYTRREQVEGFELPDWVIFDPTNRLGHPTQGASNQWADLGNAAFEASDMVLFDLARRISFIAFSLAWRLRELSNAYERELTAHLHANDGRISPGHLFATGNSYFIYMAAHTFLVEAGILRDYLAEFVAKYALSTFVPADKTIRTMSGLIRVNVLTRAKGKDDLAKILADATDPTSGWLARIGQYRDLVVHSSPLQSASHGMWIAESSMTCTDGGFIASIHAPLPKEPLQLAQERARGTAFTTPEDWIKETSGADILSNPDLLTFCAESVQALFGLALRCLDRAPFPPKTLQLGPDDLSGTIKVK